MNQKGNTTVLIIVGIILLAISGLLYYHIQSSYRNISNLSQTSTYQNLSPTPDRSSIDGSVTYTIPIGWKGSSQNSVAPNYSLEFDSPDALFNAQPHLTQGASIFILTGSKAPNRSIQEEYDAIFNLYGNIVPTKPIKIGGLDGFTQKQNCETNCHFVYAIVNNTTDWEFIFDCIQCSKYLTARDQFLHSIKFKY